MAEYKGPIWKAKHREYHDDLLKLLLSKDGLVVLKNGKAPYKVVLGVPHQAGVGEKHICENAKLRDSDENAASYALVAFSLLKEHDIPCKFVIAAHSTQEDPNKDVKSGYCQELFKEPTELIWECHGLSDKRKLGLELSAGPNDLTDTLKYGRRIATSLKGISDIGIQKQAGLSNALIINKDGTEYPNGLLERPGIDTDSLEEARKRGIPSLHLEAKSRFRILDNKNDEVSPDGCLLGHAIAQAIMQDWLDRELKEVEKSYTAKVLNMTGAYNREIERKKEYQGRQLLELLQNADDEAENIQEPGILIRLEENRLVVANHGLPFTKQGILSLMYSDNSPKVKRQKKIGYKGLGFRAILNWSESIHIKSGAFSLEFSKPNAIDFLKGLISKKPSLKEEINNQGLGDHPIAILAAPKWKPPDSSMPAGYDTSVIINFSSDEVRKDVQDQINELGLEVALFLNSLKTIKLESPGRNETIIRLPPGKGGYEEVQLIDDKGQLKDSKSWRIFKKADELPDNLKTENVKQTEYELRIAVSRKMDDKINRLFSYFQTEVKFPFPAIIHGTFDLEGDRKHINVNNVNKFLLEQLADLMTDTAKKITQSEEKISWAALNLLAKKGEFDDSIEKMDFYKNLIGSIKTKQLIPVLSQKYMSADEKPAFYDFPLTELLKTLASDFRDLALHTSDSEIHALLRELGVVPYQPEELVKRLNKVSPNLAPDKRAELIILLVNHCDGCLKSIPTDKMPRLFIDEQGQVIGSNTKALLPPEGKPFQLPDTVKLVFISSDLAKRLRACAAVKRNRALAEKLARFNIMEYSAAAVISRIVAKTNSAIRKAHAKEKDLIKKMVQALFTIFTDKTNKDLKFPERTTVRLFTTKGALRNTEELYFGKEYSAGKIMDALYSPIDDTIFVARKQDLGLENQTESEATDFLKWLGVEQFPRITTQKELKGQSYDKNYEEHVLRNLLKKPYQTDHGELYRSYEHVRKHLGSYSQMKVAEIETLPLILEKAKFEHVLAWLHHDPRIQGFFRDDHEPTGSSFNLDLSGSGARVYRIVSPNDMSSYIVYKLRTTAWIKTKSGQAALASRCCLSETLDGMSPLIELPLVDAKDPVLKESKVDRRAAENVLTQVGVSEDLSTLPTETIYAILSNLETANPNGEKAKRIYTGIIKNKTKEWDATLKGNEAHDSFINKGTILARNNGKTAYSPIHKVYYIENITFCREIINKFPIAEIPRRLGKDRIKDIFGVSPLEDIRFALVSEPQLHPLNSDFSKHFEKFKPYALVFRHADKKFITDLNTIKKLKVCLCRQIPAKYGFDGKEEELKLNPYEHIQPSGEDITYILLDPERKYNDVTDLKKDTRFCIALAEIISDALKVDENRKDYINLFPKDQKERDIIIQTELDDPNMEKLKEVRQRFTDVTNAQKDFWQNILAAKDIEKDLFEIEGDEETVRYLAKELALEDASVKEIFASLDYDDLSNLKNLPLVKRLFTAIGMSVKDYNIQSTENIDFTESLKAELTSEKFKLQRKFQAFVYETLKNEDIAIKETFTKILTAYATKSFSDNYDVNQNLDPDKAKCFDTAFQQEPFKDLGITYSALLKQEDRPIEETYSNNEDAFLQKLRDSGGAYHEDINSFLENHQNKSLLYFGEFDELVKRFYKKYAKPTSDDAAGQGEKITKKKKTIHLNGKDQEYEDDNYESLFDNVKEDLETNKCDISKHDPSKPEESARKKPTGGPGGGHGSPKQKNTMETGFVGEAYVYETLVKKYGQDKVFWVSENAKKANINPQGSESYGYDIHYLDESTKVRYVEVKSSSSDDNSFKISPEEVRFGEQHRKEYEVIQVLNALDSEARDIRSLGNIFDYAEEESFNNNKKFSVENERYTVRYK